MNRFYQHFSFIFFLSLLLTINVGCAGKKLLLENTQLKSEKAQLEGQIEDQGREYGQEKNALNRQIQNQTKEFRQDKEASEKEIAELKEKIKQILKEKQLAVEEVTLREEKKRLIVTLPDRILFTVGDFKIQENMKPVLKVLADHICKYPNRLILIQGHACNLPIHTEKFPSNWELSTQRSTEVLHYFIREEKLPPQQFSIMGFGEHTPQVPNTDEQGRMKNRRVEIVILSEDLSKQLKN